MTQDVKADGFHISPSQGIRLLAVASLFQQGDIEIRGDEEDDVANALATILDAAQEIALQVAA